MPAPPLKWIEVDLSAIKSNLESVRGLLKPGVGLMGVVKADAYGHGAAGVAKLLEAEGVDRLGVLTLEEGLALRRAGVKTAVHVMAPPLPEQAPDVVRAGLIPTVDRGDQLSALDAAACKRGRRRRPVSIDLDSGLGRWGVAAKDLDRFLKELRGRRGLRLEGLATHLDYMPGRNAVEAEDKLRAFGRLCRRLKRRGPAICRAANSSILLDFPHWQLDGVRIGNLLYGINPTSRPAALADPWKFLARVISVRTVSKGAHIGYGAEYIAPRRMTVAALPVGYADGLTMEPVERRVKLGGHAPYWGLLRGHRVPFIGRCGIAHVLIDASGAPNVTPGDAVALPIRRTAASPRLPRVYKTRKT